MPWTAIVFGWPSATLSLVVGVAGLLMARWKWVAAGAVVGGPFLLYLALTPYFGFISPLVGASYAGAAGAINRNRVRLAWALFAPMPVLVAYVAGVVMMANGY